jgi:hypothetical protein
MIEMNRALLVLRRIALVSTQSELDVARMDAADLLDQAGWSKAARSVIDSIGRPVPSDNRASPSQ